MGRLEYNSNGRLIIGSECRVLETAGPTELSIGAIGDGQALVRSGAAIVGLPSPVSGSGSSGQVAYWSGASTLAGDSGLTYNAAADKLTITGVTGAQQRWAYDGSNYVEATVNSSGTLNIVPTGTSPYISLNTAHASGYLTGTTGVLLGSVAAASRATLALIGNRTSDAPIAEVTFWNNATRVGALVCSRDGADNSSSIEFYTMNAGVLDLNFTIGPEGEVLVDDWMNVGGTTTAATAVGDFAAGNARLMAWKASEGVLRINSPDDPTDVGPFGTLIKGSYGMQQGADGPCWDDSLKIGGIAGRSGVSETAFTSGMLFRIHGGYLLEDVSSGSVVWRFIIAVNGNSNFGMANSNTKTPQSKLEVTGNFLVGPESWTGTAGIAAPTNGAIIQGNMGVGSYTGTLAKFHVAKDAATDSAVQVYITGETNENRRLQIGYNTTSNYGVIQANENGTSTRHLILQPSGSNVGIGIPTPDDVLHLYATNPYLRIESNGTGANGIKFELNNTVRWTVGNPSASADLRFYDEPNTRDVLRLVSGDGPVVNEDGADVNTRFEGDTLPYLLYLNGDATLENIALFGTAEPNWQSGDRILHWGDGTAPTGNPSNGIFVWSESGAGKAKGGAGTVTTWAPSEPHCPQCGYDYIHEWENARYDQPYLAVCMKCLTDEIGERPWILRKKRVAA